MTELLAKAFTAAKELAPEMQDEIARFVLTYVGDDRGAYRFTPAEEAEQNAADSEEARGDYASEADLDVIWRKYGL